MDLPSDVNVYYSTCPNLKKDQGYFFDLAFSSVIVLFFVGIGPIHTNINSPMEASKWLRLVGTTIGTGIGITSLSNTLWPGGYTLIDATSIGVVSGLFQMTALPGAPVVAGHVVTVDQMLASLPLPAWIRVLLASGSSLWLEIVLGWLLTFASGMIVHQAWVFSILLRDLKKRIMPSMTSPRGDKDQGVAQVLQSEKQD